MTDYEHGEFRVPDDVEGEDDGGDWPESEPNERGLPVALLNILAGTDDPRSLETVRSKIEADKTLTRLATGATMPRSMTLSIAASELVAAFETSIARPQGTVAGMAQSFEKLPRLRHRVELFLRLNGRMPNLSETNKLYEIKSGEHDSED